VVIPSTISIKIATAMSMLIEGVKSDYNAKELHFTDIYSGRGIWKKVTVAERMEIFDLMASVLINFELPVFYQTWSKEFKNDHELAFKKIKNLKIENFWNAQEVDHFGLMFLLFRMREGIKEIRKVIPGDFDESFQVYVDEGIAKAGNSIPIPCKGGDIFKEKVHFESSEHNLGIQIADFCAFIISRSQWIMMNKKGGEDFGSDKHILAINSKLNHWSPDIQFIKGDEKFMSKEGFEFFMKRDRQKKGCPHYKLINSI